VRNADAPEKSYGLYRVSKKECAGMNMGIALMIAFAAWRLGDQGGAEEIIKILQAS
jgi:hypothetical protein